MELFPPDLDLSQLTLTNASGSFALVQNQNSASGLFEMIFPVSCTPDWAAVNEKVLLPLKELVPDHFIAADASLSDYADEPLYTLSLSDGAKHGSAVSHRAMTASSIARLTKVAIYTASIRKKRPFWMSLTTICWAAVFIAEVFLRFPASH